MAIRVVRLGTPRVPNEGLRIGTVRRPPRGVRREELASRDFYDVWLPELSPSQELLRAHRHALADDGRTGAATAAAWDRFTRAFRTEMATPAARHLVTLLAELSRRTHLAVGCYCEDERHCHRTVLAQLLREAGAEVTTASPRSAPTPGAG